MRWKPERENNKYENQIGVLLNLQSIVWTLVILSYWISLLLFVGIFFLVWVLKFSIVWEFLLHGTDKYADRAGKDMLTPEVWTFRSLINSRTLQIRLTHPGSNMSTPEATSPVLDYCRFVERKRTWEEPTYQGRPKVFCSQDRTLQARPWRCLWVLVSKKFLTAIFFLELFAI